LGQNPDFVLRIECLCNSLLFVRRYLRSFPHTPLRTILFCVGFLLLLLALPLFRLECLGPRVILIGVCCLERIVWPNKVFVFFCLMPMVVCLAQPSLRSVLNLVSPVNLVIVSVYRMLDVALEFLSELVFEILFLFAFTQKLKEVHLSKPSV